MVLLESAASVAIYALVITFLRLWIIQLTMCNKIPTVDIRTYVDSFILMAT